MTGRNKALIALGVITYLVLYFGLLISCVCGLPETEAPACSTAPPLTWWL